MQVPNKTSAHVALIFTNIFFAINLTAVKFIINNKFVGPFGLNFLRAGITAALLWGLYFLKPQKVVIQKKDYSRLVLCALMGITLNQLLFVKGLSLTYPIHASLLILTTPILITIFAAFLLKERINNFKILGLILGVSGALVLILPKEKTGNPHDVILGDILVLLNAICYTFYFILVKPLMKVYNPIMILRTVFTLGFFMMVPFCWQEFAVIKWVAITYQGYAAIICVVVGGTFLAYLFNIYGIKILGASITGSYIYLQPLFAATIAIVFAGETIALYKIAAAILIFAGVFFVNKQQPNG